MPAPSHKRFQLSEPVVSAWYEAIRKAAKPSKKLAKIGGDPDALLKHIWSYDGDDVAQLWKTFTTDRAELPRYLQNPLRQRLAYLLGFHLPNIARMKWLLGAAESRTRLNPKKLPIHLHDLGAGTGAAAIAAIEHWGKTLSKCELHDHQPLFLESAAAQIKAIFGQQVNLHEGGLFHLLPKLKASEAALNVFTMNYVWNEVSGNAGLAKRFLQCLQRIASGTAPALLVIGEGGNQNQARGTMQLRDDLVEIGWMPVYPCPHAELCPMLERTRDWCYSEGRWSPPEGQQAIDEALGIDRSAFAISGFIFANKAAQITPQWPDAVVVGRPKETRSMSPQFKYLLCEGGRELSKSKRSYPIRPPFKMRGQAYDNSEK